MGKISKAELVGVTKKRRTYKCKYCPQKYQSEHSHQRHVRSVHRSRVHVASRACSQRFVDRSTLLDGLKVVHNDGISHHERVCPICPFVTNTISKKTMYTHFNTVHNIIISRSHYFFESLGEFETWKSTMERKTQTSYRVLYMKSSVRVYCCCDQGPEEEDSGPDESLSTYKTNTFCPSEINVCIISENSVVVSYLYTHVGHATKEKSVEPLRLALRGQGSKENGERMALREGSSKYTHNLKNFQRVNMDKFVTDLATSFETVLCIYKSVGICNNAFTNFKKEDFLLIYMSKGQHSVLLEHGDGTVSVDHISGKDFTMFTLSVLNNINEGVPVAHMFTNKVDEDSLTVFFESVKMKCGIIYCHNFMSSVAELTYSLWKSIMGEPKRCVVSTCHLLRHCRDSLNTLVANKGKRELMYNALHRLILETDERAFIDGLNDLMQSDEETCEFVEHFVTEFTVVRRVQDWAHCFSTNCNINDAMSLENIYRFLEWDENKDYKTAVISYLKTIVNANWHRKKTVTSIKEREQRRSMNGNRLKSLYVDGTNVIKSPHFPRSADAWKIVTSEGDCFVVPRQGDCNDCGEYTLSSIYRHKYVCSCAEYALRNNKCKHIDVLMQSFYTGAFTPNSIVVTLSNGYNATNVDGLSHPSGSPQEETLRQLVLQLVVTWYMIQNKDYTIKWVEDQLQALESAGDIN